MEVIQDGEGKCVWQIVLNGMPTQDQMLVTPVLQYHSPDLQNSTDRKNMREKERYQ